MADQPTTILLVEDDPADTRTIQDALARTLKAPFHLEHAGRLSTALQLLSRRPITAVLLDLQLPDNQGVSGVAAIRGTAPHVPVVVLTASDDEGLAVLALQGGAQDYLVKRDVEASPHLLARALRYAVERQRTEEEVREAHAQTEQLVSSITSILIGVTPEGVVTHWNRVAEATFGVSSREAMHRSLAACGVRWQPDEILQCVADCQRRQAPVRLDDVAYARPDGQPGYLGLTVIPVRHPGAGGAAVLLFGAELTERKQAEAERIRLQAELVQAQKMETIGRFAGGIAHDFENFIQVILGFAWLIRARHKDDSALLGDVEEIVHAAESASGMIRQLLAFSRRQALKPTVLEISRTIERMAKMLQQVVGERIRLELHLDAEPLLVQLDPTAFEQIVMNLCSNARDSMHEGGALTIRTASVAADAAFREAHPGATISGPCARLSVTDTGQGMEPQVAASIFEPFFTTKRSGRGTGLGLAVVYGLVQQHDGFIDVQTAPGRGTTFHLFFPRQELSRPAPESRSGDAPPSHPRRSAVDRSPKAGGKLRLLVVDDEASNRKLCGRILGETYDVQTASSGREALVALEREPYDLLLTDVKMPEMDGVELIQEALRRHPELRVVAMSGWLTSELEQRMRATASRCDVLHKPFTASALEEAVRRCVGGGQPG